MTALKVPCSQCGKDILSITEHDEHRMAHWSDGTTTYYCDGDCLLDWMIVKGVVYANPNPQPDV